MTPEQIAALRAALSAAGVIQPNATDQDVVNAYAQIQQQNPSQATALAQQAGVGPKISPLMWLGLIGGGIALYFIWKHYQKPKQVDAVEYPDQDEDPRVNFRRMTKTMSHLRGFGRPKLGNANCRSKRMGRFNGDEKNDFEPERRLDGYRKRSVRVR